MNDSDYHCAQQIGEGGEGCSLQRASLFLQFLYGKLNYSQSHFSVKNLSQRGQNCTNVMNKCLTIAPN